MPTLTVHVVNEDDDPVEYAKVFLLIHHNFMPDTWLEERTGSDGDADFDIEAYCTVDVSVNGSEEYSDLSIVDQDLNVTVSV